METIRKSGEGDYGLHRHRSTRQCNERKNNRNDFANKNEGHHQFNDKGSKKQSSVSRQGKSDKRKDDAKWTVWM